MNRKNIAPPLICSHHPKKNRGMCGACYQKWRFDQMGPAACHPCRREHCGGLCRECYREVGRAPRAICHPARPHVANGLCGKCYRELPERKARAIVVRRLKKYGITQADYAEIMRRQGDVCAICGGEAGAIDHNHKTKKVRGILCKPCNAALGLLRDDPELLKTAILYLNRSN